MVDILDVMAVYEIQIQIQNLVVDKKIIKVMGGLITDILFNAGIDKNVMNNYIL